MLVIFRDYQAFPAQDYRARVCPAWRSIIAYVHADRDLALK
jgi:hypothetical protein